MRETRSKQVQEIVKQGTRSASKRAQKKATRAKRRQEGKQEIHVKQETQEKQGMASKGRFRRSEPSEITDDDSEWLSWADKMQETDLEKDGEGFI